MTKIEHFYLVSDHAEQLYNLFRDEFQLPVVWQFHDYGDFSSGGLSLGNVALEFVRETGDRAAGSRTEFKGIAFEPAGDAAAAVAELGRRGISHGEPDPYTYTEEGQERVGWVTIDLEDIPPAGAYIFLCDYTERDEVAERRAVASRELVARGGGPLGITSVVEIVIGVQSIPEAARQWRKLLDAPGAVSDSTSLYTFGPGPRVRLERTDAESIVGIVLGVSSAARARNALAAKGMLGADGGGRIVVAPAAVDGLRITLVEN